MTEPTKPEIVIREGATAHETMTMVRLPSDETTSSPIAVCLPHECQLRLCGLNWLATWKATRFWKHVNNCFSVVYEENLGLCTQAAWMLWAILPCGSNPSLHIWAHHPNPWFVNKRLHGTWCQDVPTLLPTLNTKPFIQSIRLFKNPRGERQMMYLCARLFTEIALSGIIPCGTLVVPRNGCQPNTWAAAMLHLATWPTVCMIKLDDIRSTHVFFRKSDWSSWLYSEGTGKCLCLGQEPW